METGITPPTEDELIFNWEQHSSGIGRKIMSKFGYHEGVGLGREGTGRTTAIMPKKRPNPRQGISEGVNEVPPPPAGLIRKKSKKERRDGSKENPISIELSSSDEELQAPSPPKTKTIPPKEKANPVREWSIEDLRKAMELRLKIHYLVTSQDRSPESQPAEVIEVPAFHTSSMDGWIAVERLQIVLKSLEELQAMSQDLMRQIEPDRRSFFKKSLHVDEKARKLCGRVRRTRHGVLYFCGAVADELAWAFELDELQARPDYFLQTFGLWKELLSRKIRWQTHHLWNDILKVVLEKMGYYLRDVWADVKDYHFSLVLVEEWTQALPRLEDMIRDVLPAKLLKEVRAWDPQEDENAAEWILPWSHRLGNELEEVLYLATLKIRGVLNTPWTLEDASVLAFVQPWTYILYESLMEQTLIDCVLPKVDQFVVELDLDPTNDGVTILSQWSDVFRISEETELRFVDTFEENFVPRWLQYLHDWLLEDDVSFDEVQVWYLNWKLALSFVPGVYMHFQKALQLINAVIS
eukprot:TRINITY_DN5939_c0_g3_i2.p1 TRINITY_DN5939_c0_g3~~TRINITY_DN5939_c0_g3_i2.p1  ORF type:complete len:523 (+),score=131.85 TRINITY_DN5939_c0_g3_i2:69-1637(+)